MKKLIVILLMLVLWQPSLYAGDCAVSDYSCAQVETLLDTVNTGFAAYVTIESINTEAELKTVANISLALNRDIVTLAFTNDATQTEFTSANMLLYGSFSNKGDDGETDIILDNPSYQIKETALVEYAAVIEICPPSGESFDLNGTTLTADFCIESPAIIGSKAVFTRMYSDTLTAWFWSVDTVRGAWIDGGDTGD